MERPLSISPALGGGLTARSRLHFSPVLLTFDVFVLLLGAASAAILVARSNAVDFRVATLLALLVCAFARLEFSLPGAARKVPATLAVTFMGLALGPPLLAFAIAALGAISRVVLGTAPERDLGSLGTRIATTSCSVLAAATVYNRILSRASLGWFVAALAAAFVYFAVDSVFESMRTALAKNESPLPIWRSDHFWTLPAYLLGPLGVGLTYVEFASAEPVDFLVGLGLAIAIGAYVNEYFSELRRREFRAQKLESAHEHAIEALAGAMTATERAQPAGLGRIKTLAEHLGNELGCAPAEVRTLMHAAVLRDVGKVAVPESILNKPGRLTPQEFDAVAAHSQASAAILENADFPAEVKDAVRAHHEHWDGSGYPQGLSGASIPRLARMLAVLDCYDALVSDRPYRPAFSPKQALELVREQRGRMFDPEVVDGFLEIALIAEAEFAVNNVVESPDSASGSPRVHQTWMESAAEQADHLRQDTLRRLIASPEQLVAFYDILRLLGADLNFSKTLTDSLRILSQALNCDKAALFVEQNGRFVMQHAFGFPEHCVGRLELSRDSGYAAEVIASRRPMIADGPPSESSQGKAPRYLDDVQSCLIAPLLADDAVVGVLTLCSLQRQAFEPSQTSYLSLVTEKMASTVVSSRALEQIYHEAETDSVTKLPNARAAFRRLEDEIQRAGRLNQTIAVLFLDLDGLKPVNDTHGHGAGDKLLAEVARKMRSYLRSYDFLARVGGDEFLAIVPGISLAGVEGKVEALKKAVREQDIAVAEGAVISPSVSIGAAVFPQDATEAEELIYLSDHRMYQDKQNKRNRQESGQAMERILSGV